MIQRRFIATMFLCSLAIPALGAQDWEPRQRWRDRDGVHIRIGRDYHLPADQIATTPIVVIGGSATIDGRVDDDLVVLGGRVRIGPRAQVRANLVALGGHVEVADTAEISGEIHDVGVIWPEIRFGLREWLFDDEPGWWAAVALAGTVFRFTVTMIAACLLALVAPGWIRRIQDRAADAPLASAFVGLASQILMVPVFVAVVAGLVLTIVGIPLLLLVPFAGLALLVTWIAGLTAVAALLGGRLRGRSRLAAPDAPVLDVASGLMLLFVVTFASNVLAFWPLDLWPFSAAFGVAGVFLEYLAWTVGLGAALLAPLRRRVHIGPPPIPAPLSARA